MVYEKKKNRQLTIAYVLPPRKAIKMEHILEHVTDCCRFVPFPLDELIEMCQDGNDANRSINDDDDDDDDRLSSRVEQMMKDMKFDVFLHKLSHDYAFSLQSRDATSSRRIEFIHQYLELHPSMLVLDPLSSIQTLLNRNDYFQILHTFSETQEPLQKLYTIPPFCCIDITNVEPREQKIQFPAIVKPVISCGTLESHSLAVIPNEHALEEYFNRRSSELCHPITTTPLNHQFVVQKYINHNGWIAKLYVMGEHVFIDRRPSLPNVSTTTPSSSSSSSWTKGFEFDSQRRLPSSVDFQLLGNEMETPAFGHDVGLLSRTDETHLIKIAHSIRTHLQLTLLGVDVIRSCVNPDDWYVVDVNYFPSFKGLGDSFDQVLRDHVHQAYDHSIHQYT